MSQKLRRILRKRSIEFEFSTAGIAVGALFIAPMWMDFLHNNFAEKSFIWQVLIGGICTIAAFIVLGRLIWIYWE